MSESSENRKVVVTLTPLPIRADSRTFKQAASVARLGYRSIVLEGPSSELNKQDLPFELVATSEAPPAAPTAQETPDVPPQQDVPAQNDMAVVLPEGSNEAPKQVFVDAPPVPTGQWDRIRKSIRGIVEKAPGGERLKNVLWLAEHKIRFFFYLLRTDPARLFRGIVYFFYVVFFRKIFSLVIKTSNKLVYSYANNLRRHVFDYFKLYLLKTFKKTQKGDLYYLHSFYQYPAVYLRSRLSGARYIYDAHDFYSEMDGDSGVSTYWREWVMPFQLWIERACVRNAAAVVTVNEGIAALMKKKFGRDVIVLRNSHDPRLEMPVERTIRDVLALGEESRLIVCVGQWKRDTAIAQAIAAFGTLPERFHLAFLGAGFPPYDAEIAAHGVKGRVHFLPAVKALEVVPFIRSADIGLLLYHPVSPSIRNCLPNGFFQPTAAGLPILYPRLPEIMRVAEQYDLGLPIDPLDPASIAEAVALLGGNDDLFHAKKANVHAARADLSWERDEQQLKMLIEGLIGPPLRRRAS